MITLTPSTALSHNSGPALQRQSSAAVSQLTLNGLRKEKPGPVGIPAFHTAAPFGCPPTGPPTPPWPAHLGGPGTAPPGVVAGPGAGILTREQALEWINSKRRKQELKAQIGALKAQIGARQGASAESPRVDQQQAPGEQTSSEKERPAVPPAAAEESGSFTIPRKKNRASGADAAGVACEEGEVDNQDLHGGGADEGIRSSIRFRLLIPLLKEAACHVDRRGSYREMAVMDGGGAKDSAAPPPAMIAATIIMTIVVATQESMTPVSLEKTTLVLLGKIGTSQVGETTMIMILCMQGKNEREVQVHPLMDIVATVVAITVVVTMNPAIMIVTTLAEVVEVVGTILVTATMVLVVGAASIQAGEVVDAAAEYLMTCTDN
eukprot:CAMPEP_0206371620 /NCGR_PEP_ID=MMETSP0294-20121207/6591_1 /ASSEMBLY_ACC=CAM_ASM_000327 /TAXON_ID=39354 /ORGANISM="Heterosigma akashiwo, Strain CCMP2393" /LENGTH=377 /DNA_ID=CAMNT_0053818781 /DNA_START=205 /DNA_END=1340 /DNA_ORIENTATION=+